MKPKTADEYMNSFPGSQKAKLSEMREIIQSVLPEAEEAISSNVPAFRYKGRYLVSYSATKNHVALLVMQGNAMKSFAGELEGYDTGSRIIRFKPDMPLPKDLIEKIVKYRSSEIDAK